MLHSVEFYVILTVIAAAVLAFCIRPAKKGLGRKSRSTGWLVPGEPGKEPFLAITCNNDGSVTFRRKGLSGMYADGVISIDVYQGGFDLEIFEKKDFSGHLHDEPCHEAVFVLTDMAPDWHHVRWNCDPSTRFAAFSLHVRPGLKQTVALHE